MRNEEFEQYLNITFKEINNLLIIKGNEYSPDHNDRFHNFRMGARILGVQKEQVMMMYATKHMASILDIINNVNNRIPDAEKITEKFNDMISYLIIMKASLLKEIGE